MREVMSENLWTFWVSDLARDFNTQIVNILSYINRNNFESLKAIDFCIQTALKICVCSEIAMVWREFFFILSKFFSGVPSHKKFTEPTQKKYRNSWTRSVKSWQLMKRWKF